MGTVFDLLEHSQEKVESKFVTGKQNVFLVSKIVVEVAFGHMERPRDFVHARAVVATATKGSGSALHNFQTHLAVSSLATHSNVQAHAFSKP